LLDRDPGAELRDDVVMTAAVRILVAEDEFLVAMLLEDDLREAGFQVVGPFTTFEDADAAAHRGEYDIAVLDVNLNGVMSYPIARRLRDKQVPFILLSGYGVAALPEDLRDAPRLAKPYETNTLLREVRLLAGQDASAPQSG